MKRGHLLRGAERRGFGRGLGRHAREALLGDGERVARLAEPALGERDRRVEIDERGQHNAGRVELHRGVARGEEPVVARVNGRVDRREPVLDRLRGGAEIGAGGRRALEGAAGAEREIVGVLEGEHPARRPAFGSGDLGFVPAGRGGDHPLVLPGSPPRWKPSSSRLADPRRASPSASRRSRPSR